MTIGGWANENPGGPAAPRLVCLPGSGGGAGMSTWRINDGGNWRAQAACSAENRDKFFPEGRPSEEPFSLCERCEVREKCLETALNAPWRPYGIWGGLTTRELWPMWKQRHPRHRENEILQLLGLAG